MYADAGGKPDRREEEVETKGRTGGVVTARTGRMPLLRYTLEAQLENVSDGTIVLEAATLHAKAPFGAVGLNWDFFNIIYVT